MKALTNFMLKSAIAGGTFIGLGLLTAPAQAISISYRFDRNDNGLSTITKTNNNGVTATFSNPSPDSVFYVDDNGLALNALPTNDPFLINQFTLSFDKLVTLESYYITVSVGTGTFSLTNPNGGVNSINNPISQGIYHNFNNPFSLNAGQTSILNASFSSPTAVLVQIEQIRVDYTPTAVPWETDALPVIGSTILFGFGVWAKRKSVKPLEK
jgi:hypothetical protein